ncbi:MAG: T9SS type A sorting domain-containing protein [Sphingobacteriales bacterium]|nr:T9SS type A sorting domain-containing protein [Sphingobacteriales bacterium]
MLLFVGSVFLFFSNRNNQGHSYSANPPEGYTGFGVSTCGNGGCHSATAGVNSNLMVVIEDANGNAVSSYLPGTTYNVNVHYMSSHARYGFAMRSTGTDDFFTAGSNTVVEGGEIQHGSVNTTGTWDFTWTAPIAGTGTVTFYIGGIGANGNGSTDGDTYYEGTFTLAEGSAVATSTVTFLLDGNCAPLTTASTPYIAGDFQGWDPATSAMTDSNGDGIWEATFEIEQGSTVQYKFLSAAGWGNDEGSGLTACGVDNGFGGYNRSATIPATATASFGPVAFNSCEACPVIPPDNVEVTFLLDGACNGVTAPYIAGSFQGWDPTANAMTDSNSDGIWEATFTIAEGSALEFKFLKDGSGWGSDESAPAECGNGNGNRTYTVPMDVATATYGPVAFGSCEVCPAPPVCLAEAGTVTPPANTTIAFGGTSDAPTVSGQTESTEYSYIYVLTTDSPGNSTVYDILEYNTTGSFSFADYSAGTYNVHGLSILSADVATAAAAIDNGLITSGEAALGVIANGVVCAELIVPGYQLTVLPAVVFDCETLQANIGDACDDGNANTENDMVTSGCECAGTVIAPTYDCENLQANVGDACDDGNANTENDMVNTSCECAGTVIAPTYDCENLQANVGDACDDGNANTENDMVNTSCECAGTVIAPTYDCENLQANVGDACNDGNANTENDMVNTSCECAGTVIAPTYDCENLQANIGDACNDGNANTENDMVNTSCECAGTVIAPTYDCENLQANVGDACNDGNANTENDMVNTSCVCAGTAIDPCAGVAINVTYDQLDCTEADHNNGTYSVEISWTGGVAPYSIDGAVTESGISGNSYIISNQTDGSELGILNIQDANGCTGTVTLPAMDCVKCGLTVSHAQLECTSAQQSAGVYSLAISWTGGVAPYSVTGATINYTDVTGNSIIVSDITDGTALGNVTVTDANSCDVTANIPAYDCAKCVITPSYDYVPCSEQMINEGKFTVNISWTGTGPFDISGSYEADNFNGNNLQLTFTDNTDLSFYITNNECNASLVVPGISCDKCQYYEVNAIADCGPNTASTYCVTLSAVGGQTAGPYNITGTQTLLGADNNTTICGLTKGEPYEFTVFDTSKGCIETVAGAPCPLSADLIRFEGEVIENGNQLSWATAAEINTDYYILERSLDGINFVNYAKIDAAGNTASTQVYAYLDNQVEDCATYFYRLSEVDALGNQEIISDVIRLQGKADACLSVEIAPIPASSTLNVNLNMGSDAAMVTLKVTDLLGRVITQQNVHTVAGFNQVELNIADYAVGTYFLSVEDGLRNTTMKFVKK